MRSRRSKFRKEDGPTSRLSGDCAVDGCDRPQFRQGYCGSHFKRKQRGRATAGLIGGAFIEGGFTLGETLSLEELVIISGSAMLDAPDDDREYRRRRRKFLRCIEQWMESIGWRRPLAVRRR